MPRKLIKAQRNGSYGPPLVTTKYAPLQNISFSDADKDLCDGLMIARWRVLNSMGLLPQRLNLILPDWDKAFTNERGKKPPLVVISNNRSLWIKAGMEAGKKQLKAIKELDPEEKEMTEFDNASDLRALTALIRQKVSPPMYSPFRIGKAAGERNVYIVVHALEYQTYRTNLDEFGVTIVGWEFQRPGRSRAFPLCGFGASRFAAIEFCKALRTAAGDPWDYAWLFDDNVVAFTNFAGYVKVEAAIARALTEEEEEVQADGTKTKRKKRYICAGFRGGTNAEPMAKNKGWAEGEVKAAEREGPASTRGKQAKDLPKSIVPGLVQQAALWNIAELSRKNLNFGPIFITSGEDVSLGKYFDLKGIRYLFYNGIRVIKEETYADGGEGAAKVEKGKNQIAQLIAESEWLEPPRARTPPPPIWFKPVKRDDDKGPFDDSEQVLGLFIRKTVIPNASEEIKKKVNDRKTVNTAMCQATEQTICKAIELNQVRDPALDKTFKVNAEKLIEVVQISSDDE